MVESWLRNAAKLKFLCFLLVLPACTKKTTIVLDNTHKELEARYYDIPIVANTTAFFEPTENGLLITYQTQSAIEDIIQFYLSEMECFGWQLIWEFKGKETCMHFEKPTRWLSLSVRPGKKENSVVIINTIK